MATTQATKKPTTRKKTTRRGPTKAAALKALGLTQEDLDVLKQVATARSAQSDDAERDALEEIVGHDLSGRDQDEDSVPPKELDPPSKHATEVEATEPGPPIGPFYARNLRGTDLGFRLSRQEERGKKRTDLKPRGQRGDLVRLEPEDLDDPVLQSQINYDLIEIITAAEAKSVLAKQGINEQQRIHPAMAILRNELGKPYEQGAVKLAPEFNKQGVVVARLDSLEGSEVGAVPSQGRGIDWAAARDLNRSNPNQSTPQGDGQVRPPRGQEADFEKDRIARDAKKRGVQGLAAGLGGLNITVEPTERN